jgi:DNA-binding IclR family transcriptional regulator
VLQTVNHAGRVLDLFSSERPEWGATAVAQELGMAKSQAHRLLVSLAEIGLLQRRQRGRYTLGWRLVSLHRVLLATNELKGLAQPVMRAVLGHHGETLQLAVWDGRRAICIAAHRGSVSDAVPPYPVGAAFPAHCTAPGKILLASRPEGEVRRLLERYGLERRTERTISSVETLDRELTSIRVRGLARELEEYVPGVACVAAPIIHGAREVVAALSMSVPALRSAPCMEHYELALAGAASRISRVVSHGAEARDAERPAVRIRRTTQSAGAVHGRYFA